MTRRILLVFVLSAATAPCWADVLAVSPFTGQVLRFNEVTGAAISAGSVQPSVGGPYFPQGVTVGPDGNIYVTDGASGEVLFFSGSTGAPLPSPLSGGRPGLFSTLPTDPMDPNDLASPAQLKFGPTGDLYVADNQKPRVYRVNGTTGVVAPNLAAQVEAAAGGIDFLPNGDLIVADFGNGDVWRVEPTDTQLADQQKIVDSQPQVGPMFVPSSVLVEADGSFYAVDLGANQFLKFANFPPNGYTPIQATQVPPAFGTATNPPNPQGNFPSSIIRDVDGTYLVGVLGAGRPDLGQTVAGAILRYNADGSRVVNTAVDTALSGLMPIGSLALIPAVQTIGGDFDRDGVLTSADYTLWSSTLGQRVALGSAADGNQNGFVDAGDYTLWRDRLPLPAATSAVPEPTTVVLLVGLTAAGFFRRWV
jgi:sugar lactone lactonase YvrE